MDIASKIALLLNKAEDNGCTNEEAEAFFSKAQALVSKYQIDEEIIRQRRGASAASDTIDTEFIDVPAMYEQAHVALWSTIAKANDVHLFTSRGNNGKGKRVAITGYSSDRTVVKMLVVSMQIVALREAKSASRLAGGDYYYRREFILAFARTIGRRIAEQRANALAAHKSETGNDMSLALVDKNEQAKNHALSTFALRSSRARGLKSGGRGASQAGAAAAANADIGNKRVGNTHKALS